jgi:menaquinone-dependent protoporphyrinogen oxidase
MDDKILVAFASKSGTTVDVAQMIGKSLSGKGANVDVRPVKSVTSLDGYRAVVIGSGIRFSQWLPEAAEFVKNNQARLREIPTVFFTVHMLNIDDGETSRNKRAAYTEPVRKIVTPKAQVLFAGRLDFSKLSLIEVLMSKALKAREQDLRDWSKIRAWAEGVYPILEPAG